MKFLTKKILFSGVLFACFFVLKGQDLDFIAKIDTNQTAQEQTIHIEIEITGVDNSFPYQVLLFENNYRGPLLQQKTVEGKKTSFTSLDMTKTYYLVVENKNKGDVAGRKVFIPAEVKK